MEVISQQKQKGSGPERYFYHSFPRGTDKMGGVEKGLTILRSMKKRGLLLTPEIPIPKWPDILSGDPLSEPWSVAEILRAGQSKRRQHPLTGAPTDHLRERGALC
jgi:hypothetical protein